MLDRILDAYVEKYPDRTREQAYPFVIGMLSTLLNEDNVDSFIKVVKDFG